MTPTRTRSCDTSIWSTTDLIKSVTISNRFSLILPEASTTKITSARPSQSETTVQLYCLITHRLIAKHSNTYRNFNRISRFHLVLTSLTVFSSSSLATLACVSVDTINTSSSISAWIALTLVYTYRVLEIIDFTRVFF